MWGDNNDEYLKKLFLKKASEKELKKYEKEDKMIKDII